MWLVTTPLARVLEVLRPDTSYVNDVTCPLLLAIDISLVHRVGDDSPIRKHMFELIDQPRAGKTAAVVVSSSYGMPPRSSLQTIRQRLVFFLDAGGQPIAEGVEIVTLALEVISPAFAVDRHQLIEIGLSDIESVAG